MSTDNRERLRRTPLRALSFNDMGKYLNSAHAFDPIASRQLRYFLPRLLELCTANAWPHASTEATFRKLKPAGFPGAWPPAEVELVRSFFEAVLDGCLAGEGMDGAENLLAAFANAGDSIERYLELWDADRSESASRALADVITRCRLGRDFFSATTTIGTTASPRDPAISFWSGSHGRRRASGWRLHSSTQRTTRPPRFSPLPTRCFGPHDRPAFAARRASVPNPPPDRRRAREGASTPRR